MRKMSLGNDLFGGGYLGKSNFPVYGDVITGVPGAESTSPFFTGEKFINPVLSLYWGLLNGSRWIVLNIFKGGALISCKVFL